MIRPIPFREAPTRVACISCHETATLRCERCGVPLCSAHGPPPGLRCLDCETTLESQTNRPAVFLLPLIIWLVMMGGMAATFALFVPEDQSPFIAWFSLVTITLVMAPFVVGTARLFYRFAARQRFLAQHSPLSRLPVDGSKENRFDELGA